MASIKVTLSSAKPRAKVVPKASAPKSYQRIRPPAVAGMFYPGEENELRQLVQNLLKQAPQLHSHEPRAFVAPHAGYRYSGLTAAYAYKTLQAAKKEKPRRVFLIGPSHRVYLEGASLGRYDAYKTPLGLIELDLALIERMVKNEPDLSADPAAHAQEHSLEVHLPFLQEQLKHFTLVPMVFGKMEPSRVAEILAKYSEEEDLIVGSSDLSHFYDYDKAVALDTTCNKALLDMDLETMASCEACGNIAIRALMQTAQKKGWQPELADYRNSGDTAGDKSRVVGYASYLFMEETPVAEKAPDLSALPGLVRTHLQGVLEGKAGMDVQALAKRDPMFEQPGATFITLTKNGQLRGCIGSLQAHRTLADDLLANGVSAALKDPRFPAVTREELDDLRVEVSLLTEPVKLVYSDTQDLLHKLKPGVHGVILSMGMRRGTFLPQVWEQLPTTEQFLNHLCKKAGLDGQCWKNNPEISVYTVEKVKEAL
ncbi:AmmeMemoRadiSam system protein B [Magnetococcus sp. PR-3]|uniref:AmmeMemoRadiSam system protein B n=1 Tax=Magnetococcus sp. PR-3 TaxID=3120355 RepID=UPI002FCE66C8